MDDGRKPLILASGEGEALWGVGALSTIKASADQTAGAYSIVEDLAPRGEGAPPHLHRADDEAFYVLDGQVTFFIGDNPPIQGTSGAFIHVPGGTVHGFEVTSDTARYLIITTPHHERFYRALCEPAQAREIPPERPWDMDKVMAACEEYGVELAGPPPESDG